MPSPVTHRYTTRLSRCASASPRRTLPISFCHMAKNGTRRRTAAVESAATSAVLSPPAVKGGERSALLDTRVVYCGDNIEQLQRTRRPPAARVLRFLRLYERRRGRVPAVLQADEEDHQAVDRAGDSGRRACAEDVAPGCYAGRRSRRDTSVAAAAVSRDRAAGSGIICVMTTRPLPPFPMKFPAAPTPAR